MSSLKVARKRSREVPALPGAAGGLLDVCEGLMLASMYCTILYCTVLFVCLVYLL